jgi:cytoskeletal protein RodZ
MQTSGDLLLQKRLEKELTLEGVAQKLKVKQEYLQAIEQGDYQQLPNTTTTKGILRNYAKILYLNPDTIVAMFRRDYAENEKGDIIPRGSLNPVLHKPRLISANSVFIALGIIAFVGYISFQLLSLRSLPKLELISPQSGEVYVDRVYVRGTTDKDATITINNQKILVDDQGNFSLELAFPAGTHAILIKAEGRNSKVRLLEKTFQIIE